MTAHRTPRQSLPEGLPRRCHLREGARMTEAELAGVDEPVARYFRAAIAPGTPLATAARLAISGRIRIGRWLPFTSTETLEPLQGFEWSARVAGGLINGGDRYSVGAGSMDWRLLGVLPVVRAAGDDVSRSAAGRAGGEGIWLPTALLPRFGVRWEAQSDKAITARFHVDDVPLELHCELDADARLRAVWFARWGDADRTGAFGWHTAGGDISAHRTFDGLTVPAAGRFGWHYGTDRWPDGEFFRFRVTALEPVAVVPAPAGAILPA